MLRHLKEHYKMITRIKINKMDDDTTPYGFREHSLKQIRYTT